MGIVPTPGSNMWGFILLKTGTSVNYYCWTNTTSAPVSVTGVTFAPAGADAPVAWDITDYAADATKYGIINFYREFDAMRLGQ